MSTLDALAMQVVTLAAEKGATLGTAESLTAGLIAATIAEVSGASKVLMGGIVSYDPRIKNELLGVAQSVIDGVGVVSEPCARQMATGARDLLHVDIAVSATGVAGPTGGTLAIPVGTVFIGCSTAQNTDVHECHFVGNRQEIREQTVAFALRLVVQYLQAR